MGQKATIDLADAPGAFEMRRYALPYDTLYQVICFDERPCFLSVNCVEPPALQSSHLRKEYYADEKLGECALLAAVETQIYTLCSGAGHDLSGRH